MKTRRGISLIEMMSVITVATVMMAVATGLLATLFRVDGLARDGLHRQESVGRLAEQFRRDVHRAARCDNATDDANQICDFRPADDATDDAVVSYRRDGNQVVRTERTGGSVRRTEAFSLSAETAVAVLIDRTSNPPMVSLTLTRAPGGPKKEPLAPSPRIDAVLGKDIRPGSGTPIETEEEP